MTNHHGTGADADRTVDLEVAYRNLNTKFIRLADVMAQYMYEAGLERSLRVEKALALRDRLTEVMPGVETNEYPECCFIGNGSRFVRSGVLVAPRVVLTAAHTFTDEPFDWIKVVRLDNTDPTDPSAIELLDIHLVDRHSRYNSDTCFNDIAVVILRSPSKARPVRIATKEEIDSAKQITVVGFGYNDCAAMSGFGAKRKGLLDIGVPPGVLNPETELKIDPGNELTAGGTGSDTCHGDSGGPAYIGVDGGYKLAGLTSRAYPQPFVPGDGGIYTRVDVHHEFIRTVAGYYDLTVP